MTGENNRASRALISIVLPVYNELHALDPLTQSISEALSRSTDEIELIFVNDGSTDGSAEKLDELAARSSRIRVLHFSRNFGHQAAVQAGLAHARGAAIVLMDSDLQDDPRALPTMIDRWRSGFDVVYAVRVERTESVWKRALFAGFYRVLNQVSNVQLPLDAGNFSLFDRSVLSCINELPERDRYFPGLRSWVGFRQTGIPVARLARYDVKPRVSLRGLFRLAKTALFSFSNVPLSMFYGIGALAFLLCVTMAIFAMYHKLFSGLAIPGWTSTTMIVSLFGAINALGIAILGEYATRIYDQVRGRPNYLIARTSGAGPLPEAVTPSERILRGGADSCEAELLDWLAENWAANQQIHASAR